MDATLWRGVVADLTIRGMTRLVAEFLKEMDLNGITLVGNDWAQLLVSEGLDGRVGSGGTG